MAVVCIAVIVVVAVAGIYGSGILNQQQPAEKGIVITNFSDGAWANYTANIYDANGQAFPSSMMTYTTTGTYKDQNCWIYIENDTYPVENGIRSDVDTYYLGESSYENLGQKHEVYINGVLTSEEEITAGDERLVNDRATFGNMAVIAKDISITVPAGTFTVTEQEGPVYYFGTDTTYDATAWLSKDIPCWGIVKYEFYINGVLDSDYQLESYGS